MSVPKTARNTAAGVTSRMGPRRHMDLQVDDRPYICRERCVSASHCLASKQSAHSTSLRSAAQYRSANSRASQRQAIERKVHAYREVGQ